MSLPYLLLICLCFLLYIFFDFVMATFQNREVLPGWHLLGMLLVAIVPVWNVVTIFLFMADIVRECDCYTRQRNYRKSQRGISV